ncbi:histidine kinase [Novosphingobium album (ex Liu et al. 2023)]|uniref:Histidine kinase n=1 Tax=Novosphingobium album (ex Liu et al. 2023) TaxID=3031130 RepID=A0ABT5WLV0_9SPHN|nr:histidine kinase [Novosphingobium album (ex Liu et al. 2023)]MDE8651019.1 histidine kinase [Novosphingobium album (ex Liu et al. 2023)]
MKSAGFKPTPIFRERRRPQLVKFELRNARDEVLDIIVRDVSSRGFSAAAKGAPPTVNEVVSMAMPDGRLLWGMVRWVEDNLFGVEFDTTSAGPA